MQNKEDEVQVLKKQLDHLRSQVADKERSVENSKCAYEAGAASMFVIQRRTTRCTNLFCLFPLTSTLCECSQNRIELRAERSGT